MSKLISCRQIKAIKKVARSQEVKVLDGLLIRLSEKIGQADRIEPKVSAATVGWHIAHSLITLDAVVQLLAKSDPDTPRGRVNFSGWVVLNLGWIPRGKGKAPRASRPKEQIDVPSLAARASETRERIKQLPELNKNQYFQHPYFGDLNLKRTIRFLEIHTKHHLKIIEAILRAR